MVGFSGILGIGQVEDRKMIKDKLIDGKKSLVGLGVNWWKWLEMLPKIRQILLHWGYELMEKDFF